MASDAILTEAPSPLVLRASNVASFKSYGVLLYKRGRVSRLRNDMGVLLHSRAHVLNLLSVLSIGISAVAYITLSFNSGAARYAPHSRCFSLLLLLLLLDHHITTMSFPPYSRMLKAGVLTSWFWVQHRYTADIAALINAILPHGCLQTAAGDTHGIVRRFYQGKLRSPPTTSSTPSARSRSCWSLLVLVSPHEDIRVPYTAQLSLYIAG